MYDNACRNTCRNAVQMMLRHRNKVKALRTSSGKFSCSIDLTLSSNESQSPPNEPHDSSEQLSAPDDNGASISDSDYSSNDEWRLLPIPLTLDECIQRKKVAWNAEKQAKCTEVWRQQRTTQIQSAEHQLDGQIDRCRGVKRGAYHVGGMSKCTLQTKRQKIRQSSEA